MAERPLVRDDLINLQGDGPLPGQSIHIPQEIARRLTENRQLDPCTMGVTFHPPEIGLLDRLVLEESVRESLTIWATDIRKQQIPIHSLIFSGSPGSGRATIARAAASAAGLSLVLWTWMPAPLKIVYAWPAGKNAGTIQPFTLSPMIPKST